MARDRFTFSENFKEIADALDDDKRLKFYDAITNYIFKDIEPTDPYIVALFNSMKYLLDRTQFWGGKRTGAGAPKGNANAKKINQVNQDSIKIQSNDNQETIKNNQNQSSVKLDCFAYNKNNINKINNTQELENNNTGKSNKGVIGGKEKGDLFVDALEKEELAKAKKTHKPKKEQPKILYTGKHEYLKAQIERWLEYKQSRKEMYKSPQSVLVCVKRLHELCGGDVSVAEKIIDQSIGNNWAGLFALKQQPQKTKSISSPDYVGEGSFLRRAEDDPFCADL